MKRTIYKKYEDAEEALASIDRRDVAANGWEYVVHYPEMTDSILNKRGRKVSKRKVRSIGMIKRRGSKMRET